MPRYSDDDIAKMSTPRYSDEDIAAMAPKEGAFEAGTHALAKGLTFGASEPIIAGGRGFVGALQGEGSYSDLYDKYLDEQRARGDKLAKENPKVSSLAGFAGAVASPLNKVIPAGNLVKNIGGGAISGGIMGATGSRAHPTESWQQLKQYGSDIGHGVMTGAAGGVAATGIVNSIKAAPGLAKKGASVLLGASEDAVDRYIKNAKGVMESAEVPEIVDKFKALLVRLKDKVKDSSQTARGKLGPESEMTGQELADFFQKHIDEIESRSEGALTDSEKATIGWLKAQQAPWLKKVGTEGDQALMDELGDELGGTHNDFIKSLEPSNAEKSFSGSRVKDVVQDIQQQGKYGVPNEYSSAQQGVIKGVGHDVNAALKASSPEYEKAMEETARLTRLSKEGNALFKTDQGLANTMNRVRRDRAPFAEDIFNKIDEEFGTKTVEEMRNALARESFEKGAAGPGGSRNVNLYRGMLSDFAKKWHIPFGDALGAVLGGTVDKHGPGIAKGAIDAYRAAAGSVPVRALTESPALQSMTKDLGHSALAPGVTEYLMSKKKHKAWTPPMQLTDQPAPAAGEQPDPEAIKRVLDEASSRGPEALQVALKLLMQKYPNMEMPNANNRP